MVARSVRLLAGTAMGSLLAGCALLTSLPPPADVKQRLAAIPRAGAPLDSPVRIYWSERQVPFVEAASDDDLAVALGIVHAHLRLGQMEVARRIARGRIAEMGGLLATDIDHALRILDFDRGVDETLAAMPASTRRWLERFVAGVNFYLARIERLPHEFRVLGLERDPWTIADVLAVGRLASTDVNWFVWFAALQLRERADWPRLWARLVEKGSASVPSFGPGAASARDPLTQLLTGFSKTGSNSVAVAGSRTASGAALVANDPHLGVLVPNLWLLAGYKSPSYHAVGMMIPGVPVIALGRNERIAWGGTNMRALSSDLVDVSALPPSAFTSREERIGVRWWFDETIEVRETRFGPVVSDAPQVAGREGEVLALRWMGHGPSDEIGAMLGVNRARDWPQFREALAGFAVPGQNMLYGDAEGHIGQVMAVWLPRRPAGAPDDLVLSADAPDRWREFATASDLPAAFDPEEGYLASANNKPARTDLPVGWFFSSDDRITRLRELLSGDALLTADDLASLQRDVHMASAVVLRDILLARLENLPSETAPTAERRRVIALLRDWDGNYDVDSVGALAFEIVMARFLETYFSAEERAAMAPGGHLDEFLGEELVRGDASRLAAALGPALEAAHRGVESFGRWGEMHRIRLQHPLAFLPLIGDRYRFVDAPVGGSSTTLMKTAHADTAERHFTSYGSQARHISDLADPDANRFALLGGQDGWLNSTTFLDQFELWQRGDYVRLPLRLETVRAAHPHHMELVP